LVELSDAYKQLSDCLSWDLSSGVPRRRFAPPIATAADVSVKQLAAVDAAPPLLQPPPPPPLLPPPAATNPPACPLPAWLPLTGIAAPLYPAPGETLSDDIMAVVLDTWNIDIRARRHLWLLMIHSLQGRAEATKLVLTLEFKRTMYNSARYPTNT
jgi:hypothetical protein